MCKFTIFHFFCGAQKLKIATACERAKTNYQGLLYCQDDPQAHVSDGKQRDYAPETYGPGICTNVNCRTAHGMAPPEQIDFKQHDLIEDDSEFDMSPEACAEREDRWYRQCLTTRQQLDVLGAAMPPSIEAMSSYAKWWLYIEHMPPNWFSTWTDLSLVDKPDEMSFLELNPRYLSQRALHHVTGHYLPANITDTRHSRQKRNAETTTPRMPALGPFRVKTHICRPNVGYCKTCGDWHGKEFARRPHRYVEADFSQLLQALANDRATDLSGLRVDLPHVRPTLNVPTPFHGNNYNRRGLTREETGRLIEEFVVGRFGEEYQASYVAAEVSAADEYHMPDLFPGVKRSGDLDEASDVQRGGGELTEGAIAEHAALVDEMLVDNVLASMEWADGVVKGGDDAMMLGV